MIRFQPDTLRDALWRPISMAAPDAGVYMEIMVPDLRYAALALLTVATLLMVRRWASLPRAAWLLLAFVWLAFVPWLATTGNGRYFLPVLVVTGPLCIALIYHLPVTAPARLSLALVLVVTQGMVVKMNDPRGAWSMAPWGEPYFEIALTPEERDVPATYALASNVSYSLIAPQFHPDSRWIGLTALSGDLSMPLDRMARKAIQDGFARGHPLRLFVPTVPDYVDADRQPMEEIRTEIDRLVRPHRMALDRTKPCKLLNSRTLAARAFPDLAKANPATVRKMGFWVCSLQYDVDRPPPPAFVADTAKVDPVFEKLERACPRFLPPGEARTEPVDGGFVRRYPSSDFKAFVMDNGEVWFRYWRALNSNYAGKTQDVLADSFTVDCNQTRGRSGLPWERVL